MKLSIYFLGLILIIGSTLYSDEVTIETSIKVSSVPVDYSTWKTKRINMQLQREHNTILINSLLQPAAVLGSIFCSGAIAVYTVALFSGQLDRHDIKNFTKSIKILIELVQIPFALQYEKNKAQDRIAEMIEQLATRQNFSLTSC